MISKKGAMEKMKWSSCAIGETKQNQNKKLKTRQVSIVTIKRKQKTTNILNMKEDINHFKQRFKI